MRAFSLEQLPSWIRVVGYLKWAVFVFILCLSSARVGWELKADQVARQETHRQAAAEQRADDFLSKGAGEVKPYSGTGPSAIGKF